jgi:HSP20 family protein
MIETAAATARETQSIDRAIEQVEGLYKSLTGQEAPAPNDRPYQPIPPERSPEQFIDEQIDRLVTALGTFTGAAVQSPSWTPPVSMWEGENELVVRVDLPGVPSSDARVTATRGMLEVAGRRMPSPPEDTKALGLRHIEAWHGEFRRRIPLPPGADVDRLEAKLRDGVLEISVPRYSQPSNVRSVPVA